MRNAMLIFIGLTLCFSNSVEAQKYVHSNSIGISGLIGRWQRNTNMVGNGLGQNFQFFKDSSFILHLGDDGDDARRVVSLKGKYLIKKDALFFTILSQTEIIGGKVAVDPDAYGLSFHIFNIDSGKLVEFPVKNPIVEAPCYITIINKSCIKLDNETYYRISNDPNKFNE